MEASPQTTEPTPAEPTPDTRPDLLGLSLPRMAATLAPVLDRPFRAAQIYEAIHRRGVLDFAAMTDLPKAMRDGLTAGFRLGRLDVTERRVSADGTAKVLYRLPDGATIEAVDIPDRDRRTFCVSSQAGCALACSFCVTGYWGAGRNLTAGEIVAQVLGLRRDGGLVIGDGLNLVFMGMGEPLHNLENLKDAIDLLAETISLRRITVSTVGVVPGIAAMAGWERRPNLAVSLHAPDDTLRSRIMPINRTYPLRELFAALDRYPLEKGRRITYEYILIQGVNDAPRQADQLAKLLAGRKAKVNLIPVNPDPVLGAAMVPPADAVVQAFQERLYRHGLTATVRRRRGDDVAAACGQLRAFGRDPRGFRVNPAAR